MLTIASMCRPIIIIVACLDLSPESPVQVLYAGQFSSLVTEYHMPRTGCAPENLAN